MDKNEASLSFDRILELKNSLENERQMCETLIEQLTQETADIQTRLESLIIEKNKLLNVKQEHQSKYEHFKSMNSKLADNLEILKLNSEHVKKCLKETESRLESVETICRQKLREKQQIFDEKVNSLEKSMQILANDPRRSAKLSSLLELEPLHKKLEELTKMRDYLLVKKRTEATAEQELWNENKKTIIEIARMMKTISDRNKAERLKLKEKELLAQNKGKNASTNFLSSSSISIKPNLANNSPLIGNSSSTAQKDKNQFFLDLDLMMSKSEITKPNMVPGFLDFKTSFSSSSESVSASGQASPFNFMSLFDEKPKTTQQNSFNLF